MTGVSNTVQILLLAATTLTAYASECPIVLQSMNEIPSMINQWRRLQEPCSCISSRFESVSIVCDKGDSLDDILLSLARPPSLIDSLVISNTPIEELPPYAFRSLHIKKLVLRNNGLVQIAAGAFNGPLLNSLEELEVRSNQLGSIPQTGVNEIRALRALSFSDNLITSVENNDFLSYHSRATIKRLDLTANNISIINPQGFLGLEAIEQLSLDKNRLKWIPEEALVNLPTLEELSIGVNEIATIGVGALQLPNLKSLSLEVNQIRSIPPDALQTLPNLAYLYLGSNLFSTIDSTMFFYVNQLKVLSMNNNHQIRIIPSSAFQYVPNLIRLELVECSISVIEPTALHKIPKVQVINLARNHLTHISHDTFTALPNLVTIDLSGNKISTIDDFALSQLPSLSQLDINTNRLESLPSNVFYHSFMGQSGKARVVHLYNNPWLCDKRLNWLRHWLRENPDIEIARSFDQLAKCWTPSQVSGEDLRESEAIPTETASSVTSPPTAVVPGDRMRKLIKTPAVTATSIVEFPPVILGTEEAKVSTISFAAIILGVVFGLIALCITLLVIIRCIIKAREEKSREGSRYGSDSVTSSGFNGSAYSTTGIYPEHPHHSHQSQHSCSPTGGGNSHIQPQVPYLNRPRYWWF